MVLIFTIKPAVTGITMPLRLQGLNPSPVKSVLFQATALQDHLRARDCMW